MRLKSEILEPGVWSSLTRRALGKTYRDFDRNHYLTYAGALAFFFFLSVFPLLIFLSTVLAYIPIPRLFDQILEIMSKVVPRDGMGVVRGVLQDVLRTNGGILSVSILSAIFAASSGFSSLITVLNIAYDVRGRPYWKLEATLAGIRPYSAGRSDDGYCSGLRGARSTVWKLAGRSDA